MDSHHSSFGVRGSRGLVYRQAISVASMADADLPLDQSLWIELAPSNGAAPKRLILVLHDALGNADQMMPIGIAWQLKFPTALVAILDAPTLAGGKKRYWYPPLAPAEAISQDLQAGLEYLKKVSVSLLDQYQLPAHEMLVIGFGQGADLALEFARTNHHGHQAITIAYAGRLLRPIGPQEQLSARIHLLHGQSNSLVPVQHAEKAQRQLEASGARVTLDIVEDLGHDIDQDMINLSTWRAMRSVFDGRKKPSTTPLLH
jgi:phospholipase/carboxylesterase